MSGENLCQCGADKSECDVLIDVYTPFLQVIGGRKYRLLFENVARQILLSDGSNVETRLKTLERALSAFSTTRFAENIYMRDTFNNQVVEGDRCYVFDASDDENVGKGGAMYLWHDGAWQLLYDGDVPLDVNSIVGEDAGLKIVDGRLAVDLDKLAAALAGALLYDEDGKLNAVPQSFNSEETITESGTWTAPVEGWYDVTCVSGGGGATATKRESSNFIAYIRGGIGCTIQKGLVFLNKGEKVPVTVGAGGLAGVYGNGNTPAHAPGRTSFKTLGTDNLFWLDSTRVDIGVNLSIAGGSGLTRANIVGAYKENPVDYNDFHVDGADGTKYGMGGSAAISYEGTTEQNAVLKRFGLGNGYQGCVILRWFDPDK